MGDSLSSLILPWKGLGVGPRGRASPYNTLLGRCLPPPPPPGLSCQICFTWWLALSLFWNGPQWNKVVENGFLIRVLLKTVFRTETKKLMCFSVLNKPYLKFCEHLLRKRIPVENGVSSYREAQRKRFNYKIPLSLSLFESEKAHCTHHKAMSDWSQRSE